MRFTGMERDPYAELEPGGPRADGQGLLQRHGGRDRVGRAPEHRKSRVALPLGLEQTSAVRFDGPRNQLVVVLERRRHPLEIRLPQTRRPLDVGQQEGDHPRRQLPRRRDRRGGIVDGTPERSGAHREPRVLRKHGPLKLAQTLARLDPELLDQRPAGVLVDLQRVRLALAPVEREHQQPAEPLAGGVLGHQLLEFADQCGVPADDQVGLNARLDGREPLLPSLAISACANGSKATSASGDPRQSASASRSTVAASSARPPASERRPSSASARSARRRAHPGAHAAHSPQAS